MFFSIIVPVYNVKNYLRECVDSVLVQTFKDFELILVDDGSNDGSDKICDEYVINDKRVKVFHTPNRGQSSARNIGVENASGEYLLFLDSDDFILNNNFLKIIKEKLNGEDLVLYKYQKYISETKKLLNCHFSYMNIKENDTYVEALEKLVYADAFYGMAWIRAIKKSIIVDNCITFEEGLKGEDMEWNYHIVTNARSLTVIEESFIAYRQRKNSTTTSLKLKNLIDFIYILEKWSKKILEEIQDIKLRDVLLGATAKYYSNLLIMYNRIADKNKKQYIKSIKNLSWVLKYSMSRRPKLVAKVCRVFGLKLTMVALKFIDKN